MSIYGLEGSFFRIITEIFKNGKQIVKYENQFSDEINVISGCFQGGVLSPTFFNVYIADINKNINNHLFAFADDLLLMRVIKDQSDNYVLQTDLDHTFEFCVENSLKLNPEKCTKMKITFKSIQKFDYHLNEITVREVFNQKYLE